MLLNVCVTEEKTYHIYADDFQNGCNKYDATSHVFPNPIICIWLNTCIHNHIFLSIVLSNTLYKTHINHQLSLGKVVQGSLKMSLQIYTILEITFRPILLHAVDMIEEQSQAILESCFCVLIDISRFRGSSTFSGECRSNISLNCMSLFIPIAFLNDTIVSCPLIPEWFTNCLHCV